MWLAGRSRVTTAGAAHIWDRSYAGSPSLWDIGRPRVVLPPLG